jgi:hypothetical protein
VSKRFTLPRNQTRRVTVDLAVVTLAEMLDCVETRLRWYANRGIEPPRITKVAAHVLRQAIGDEP